MTVGVKHARTFTYQFLTGITTRDWQRMLRENQRVDAIYWHRAAFITIMSVINSLYRRREERDYGAAIAATTISEPPIFILGHWRSGTTHLHNLLVRDRQFAYPTVYQASFPHTFLSTENSIPQKVARFVPKSRVFDNVAFHLSEPQEDEFAMSVASGYSPFLSMVFPQRADHYDRYMTLHNVPSEEIERWKATLLWFLKKLTYRQNLPIVLKSPPHTARVRLLLEMFPGARFVHIVRDPFAVYQSTRHMYDTMVWHTYLQKPDVARIDEGILRRYTMMYDAYFAERSLIPSGQLHELRFEDLRRDPVGELGNLYAALNISGFAAAETDLRGYVSSLDGYRQNSYTSISPEDRARVTQAWGSHFTRWGYA